MRTPTYTQQALSDQPDRAERRLSVMSGSPIELLYGEPMPVKAQSTTEAGALQTPPCRAGGSCSAHCALTDAKGPAIRDARSRDLCVLHNRSAEDTRPSYVTSR